MFALWVDDNTELRLMEEHHAEELYALTIENLESLRRWLKWAVEELTLEKTRQHLKTVMQGYADGTTVPCFIWHKDELAGAVDLHNIGKRDNACGMGYWLGARFRGRCLMTKACRSLMDHGIDNLGLNRVEIMCATTNQKSCAVPERLGFVREGTLRQAEWVFDHYNDLAVYSMLAEEWREMKTRRGRE